jgi:hypothetical protein
MKELEGLFIWIVVWVGLAVFDIRRHIDERCSAVDESIAELKRLIDRLSAAQ